MALPRLRPLPGLLLAVALVAELVAVPLSWGLEPTFDTLLYAVFSCAMAGTGALILSRHPRHVIGWALLAVGLGNALFADLAQGWGLRAVSEGWAGGTLGEASNTASWLPQAPAFVLIVLLFPTDRLPDPRWRVVVWLSAVGVLLAEPAWVLNPWAGGEYVAGTNPYAVDSPATGVLFIAGFALVCSSMVASLVALVRRFRSSSWVERQQLKWFALSSGVLLLVLPAAGVLWSVLPWWRVIVAVALTLWPVTIGVAVLRYRLYDVDLVISRTFTFAALTMVVAAVYAGSVIVFGALAGGDSPWVTATATLLAASAFKLLHRRVQERIDRRFRPAHHEALHQLATFLEDLRSDRAEPERIVDVLRATSGDPGLDLRFLLQADEQPVDVHGSPASAEDDDTRERSPIHRGGTVLAEVLWTPRGPEDRMLLPTVLAAAALPIEMARLRVELRRRLAEVDASRARIAAVADRERRRIERDLHDGAQQRLVSIGLALRHAQHQIDGDPEAAARTLDGAVVEISTAIEELRELAHGLQPALLAAGLGPALRDLASRSPVRVAVSATTDRYPPDLEAAAYFVACEGLTNAVKHARADRVVLEVAGSSGSLVVSVADDGVGGAALGGGSGLTGLSDRVAARGGRLRLESPLGKGTTLHVELPCVS